MMQQNNSNNFYYYISKELMNKKSLNLYRKRYNMDYFDCKKIIYKNVEYLNFSSNDYFGLSKNKKIISSWNESCKIFGIGNNSSSHVIGYTKYHNNLEKKLAKWLKFDRAVLFNSGFNANQAIIKTLSNKNDLIIADKLIHSSLLEAAILSQAKLKRFKHNDINSLKYMLNDKCNRNKIVITEGIFSMDGDLSPIDKIEKVVKKHHGILILDDAHGIGTIGNQGKGSISINNVSVDILIITFSKAFGISGAAVLCSNIIAEYLIQFSRDLIYTTFIPTAQIFAINTALNILIEQESLRKKLQINILRFKKGLEKIGLISQSHTAIQPIVIGDNFKAIKISNYLKNEHKIWISAIRPPAVPDNSSRLRIIINSVHSSKDIDRLIEALKHAKRYF